MCRPLRDNRSWGQVHLIRMRDFIGVFRSLVLSAFDAILVLLLPFLWVTRKLVFLFGHQRRVSIWTGAPIITVAKNCKAERLIGFNVYQSFIQVITSSTSLIGCYLVSSVIIGSLPQLSRMLLLQWHALLLSRYMPSQMAVCYVTPWAKF